MAIEPANPKTTPEARALLDLIYRISGKYTLTGQHNYPNTRDVTAGLPLNISGRHRQSGALTWVLPKTVTPIHTLPGPILSKKQSGNIKKDH